MKIVGRLEKYFSDKNSLNKSLQIYYKQNCNNLNLYRENVTFCRYYFYLIIHSTVQDVDEVEIL